jgi:diguanylate cyclase (GGDEF)-like protein
MDDSSRHPLDRTLQIDRSTVAESMRETNQSGKKKPCFIILGGMDVGSVYFLEKQVAVLGRDPTCDFVLKDDGISRKHVEVRQLTGDRIYVKDLHSTNGVFVDGERVEQAMVSDGEKVLLGRRTVLKYTLHDELEQSYQQQIYESSTRDGLTGVFNRKYFQQKIVSDLSFAKRHKIPFSLLMLDIDHFKKVNDTWGHRTGDQVLVTIVEAIKNTIRTEDMLARYGGEEFVIVAQGTDAEGGRALAERIRARVASETIVSLDDSRTSFRVTTSVGVATVIPGVVASPEAVVSVADKNLYEAKETGRNRAIASIL